MKGRTIAVTGKGGTGKSVIASLMITQLAKKYPGEILAIDADSAMSLPYTLGIKAEPEKTITAMRRSIVGRDDVKKKMNNKPMREVIRDVVHKGDGYDLLLMGRPEEPGCYCAVNDLLRHGMGMLVEDYRISVVDGEAGPEQINRRVLKDLDTLLVVSDMSARSLETARGIVEIALAQQVRPGGNAFKRTSRGLPGCPGCSEDSGRDPGQCLTEDKKKRRKVITGKDPRAGPSRIDEDSCRKTRIEGEER